MYWVQNLTTGKKYVGVRYAKKCHPSEFWETYFTSSPSVHKLIKLFGAADFRYKILHKYSTAEEALLREAKYVALAAVRDDYLNLCRFSPSTELCSRAEKIGGMIQVAAKLGIHKQSKDGRLALLAVARKRQIDMRENSFMHYSREKQAERGRLGGPKNRGFVWLTDGMRQVKYTAKEQQQLSIDEFLRHNPTFSKGRGPMPAIQRHKISTTKREHNENR